MCGCQGAKAGAIRPRERGESVARVELDTFSGGNGEGVPPVPIPNTEVKPFSADGTWLDTARESRSPPDSNRVDEESTQYASIAQWQSIRLLTEGL